MTIEGYAAYMERYPGRGFREVLYVTATIGPTGIVVRIAEGVAGKITKPLRTQNISVTAAGKFSDLSAAMNYARGIVRNRARFDMQMQWSTDSGSVPPKSGALVGIMRTQAPIWFLETVGLATKGTEIVSAIEVNEPVADGYTYKITTTYRPGVPDKDEDTGAVIHATHRPISVLHERMKIEQSRPRSPKPQAIKIEEKADAPTTPPPRFRFRPR